MKQRTTSLVLGLAVSLVLAMAHRANAEPNANITADAKKTVGAPLSERFADANTDEVPDFQRHVIPLMGRLGCNGRACHGSFQGRGGFQLSLFGYDFKGDHNALHEENTGRVDVDDVDESLILAKPMDADMHEGGKRFDKGTWQHHVLKRWIASGAKYDADGVEKLTQLEVVPAEIQFDKDGQAVELKAYAHWENGIVEDVTELCRFSSNDDAIAAIDEHGHVSSGARGDTHVVVYYDNAVVPVPVLRPVGQKPRKQQRKSKPIDQLVQAKLNKLGIVPSEQCTDAEFIRRASFDITGILPGAEQVREFLADKSPDKRERLIDELLDSPGYGAWWATRFSDWTGNSEAQLNNVLPIRGAGTRIWHEWLRVRLDNNVPYDEIIAGIVEANNRDEGESYMEYCKSMTEACKPGNENAFAEREGLPLYWARRNFAKPEERAIGFAYTFLGVRIECAQCHKHPFDQWSKNDFDEFAKLFGMMRYNQNLVANDAKETRDKLLEKITGGKKLRGGDLRRAVTVASRKGEVVPFGELVYNSSVSDRIKKQRAIAKKQGRKMPAMTIPTGTILGQDEPLQLDKDPRPALMEWLRSEDNPYFAKAIVNRIWSNYFGAGIVNPTDDMNLANPPSNAPLLDHLASELIAHNFDLKWLHREICNSETYQRSANTNETNKLDRTNFSHHVPRRLPAEVIYDAVNLATGSDKKNTEMRDEMDQMAIAEGKPRQRNQAEFALEVFGQSNRESNCDCDRSDSPSLLQSIYLRNDAEMHQKLADKDGWVAQACRSIGVPGPKNATRNPKQAAIERAALGYKKQIVNRIKQFKKTPVAKRERYRGGLESQYKRLVAKFKQYGFDVPPLKEILDDPAAWLAADLVPAAGSAGAANASVQDIVEDAYLRTLSRYPDEDEMETAVTFINDSEQTADGVQSLLWALVNTKEFIITH